MKTKVVLLTILVGLVLAMPHHIQAQECGWEGNRYCIYGLDETTQQTTQVVTQCESSCGYSSGTTPPRHEVLVGALSPLPSSNPPGGICVRFEASAESLDSNAAGLWTWLETAGCYDSNLQSLIFVDGSYQIVTADGQPTEFDEYCQAVVESYTIQYRISAENDLGAGEFCANSFEFVFTETGGVVTNPNPDPESTLTDTPEPNETITQLPEPQVNAAATSIATSVTLCEDDEGVQTALGCIPFQPSEFLVRLIFIGVSFAGGVAFLLLLYGGLKLMLSRGDPKGLESAKEQISAAFAGLLLIIFSVFLLRLIGLNILAIPGFG